MINELLSKVVIGEDLTYEEARSGGWYVECY